MLSYKEFLKERIDLVDNTTPYRVKWLLLSVKDFNIGYFIPKKENAFYPMVNDIIKDEVYTIVVGKSRVYYYDEYGDIKNDYNVYEIGFSYLPPGKFDTSNPSQSISKWGIDTKLPNNKSNSISIFSTVIKSAFNRIKNLGIQNDIVFKARLDEPGKVSLYNKFAEHISNLDIIKSNYDYEKYSNNEELIFFFRNKHVSESSFADLKAPKDKWVNIPINVFGKDQEINKELFDLIDKSYQYVGGHSNYKSPDDLPGGKDNDLNIVWYGIDIDNDPQPDVTIASKKTPYGMKNVLGATDGTPEAKIQYVLNTMERLTTPGYYAEMSDAIAHIMIKRHNIPSVNSQEDVEKVLGKKVEWVGLHPSGNYPDHPGWYKRKLGGEEHMKILLGKPKI